MPKFWEGSEKNTDGLKSEQPHISRSIWIRYFWASFWKFSLSASGAVTYLSSDGYAPVLQVREAVTYLSRRAGARDFLYFPSCFGMNPKRILFGMNPNFLGWARIFPLHYYSIFWNGPDNRELISYLYYREQLTTAQSCGCVWLPTQSFGNPRGDTARLNLVLYRMICPRSDKNVTTECWARRLVDLCFLRRFLKLLA